jgi:hypothetical protein
MRELYLHIGLPKTGTSSIQRRLAQNAEPLLAAGIGLGPYIDPADGESRRMRLAIREQGIGPVMSRLAASPAEKLVVSSEHLSAAMLDCRIAEAVRDAARRHFTPRIIIFLRRQDYWKESVFAQVVKYWYSGDIQNRALVDYDLDRQVADLEAVFGRENVIVRIYQEGAHDDVLATFFAILGVGVPPVGRGENDRQNVSLHRRKVLFLSRVPKPDPMIQDVSTFMTRVVTGSRWIADDGIRFLMSPQERHALVARHLEGNRALVARHGIRDAGSFAELPDPDAAWQPPAPISRAEFLAVAAEAQVSSFTTFKSRYSLRMAGKLARMLPQLAGRLFSPAPWPPSVPPPLDLLPIADLD